MRFVAVVALFLLAGCISSSPASTQALAAADGPAKYQASTSRPGALYLDVREHGIVTLTLTARPGPWAVITLDGPCSYEMDLPGAETFRCGELDPGMYFIQVKVAAGMAKGTLSAEGASVEAPRDG